VVELLTSKHKALYQHKVQYQQKQNKNKIVSNFIAIEWLLLEKWLIFITMSYKYKIYNGFQRVSTKKEYKTY
jgi:hypothetical protein